MGKVGYRFSGFTAEHKIWIGGDRLDIDSQGIQLNTRFRIEGDRLDIDSQGIQLNTRFRIGGL